MVPVVPIGGGGRGGIRGYKVSGCEEGGGGFVCEWFASMVVWFGVHAVGENVCFGEKMLVIVRFQHVARYCTRHLYAIYAPFTRQSFCSM